MPGYAVIDLETTGFSPAKHHRILEIGVVEVSETGEVEREWASLVNPGRDIANSHVHGISATDVVSAPRFEDIAPSLLDSVRGRTIVAHNAPFDLRFLEAELLRAGVAPLQLPLAGLCTMHWSSVFLDAPSRKLTDCCAASGIDLADAHSALGDARATAGLLGHYLSLLDGSGLLPWHEEHEQCSRIVWPSPRRAAPPAMLLREAAREVRPDSWLDRIVSRMPQAADARVDSYLETLERALLDGVLAEHEKDELVEVACALGLDRNQVLDLHRRYLEAMAEVVMGDGILSEEERRDLERAASVLGLKAEDVARALESAEVAPVAAATVSVSSAPSPSHAGSPAALRLGTAGIVLEPGDRIVFTGAMSRDRSSWEELARELGYVPGGVTKKTRLVVASDPNSQSGKSAKARAYGIPIITEDAFARMVGV
ncbi:exonuclease domain-containing protein [Brachybacterium sp. GCM10030268]|uniref:exonuclease domain-containing protein n=1 Tax=Brachybacterium sp. GCM10030268 TaxID=3273382 RepID=UPI003622FBA2